MIALNVGHFPLDDDTQDDRLSEWKRLLLSALEKAFLHFTTDRIELTITPLKYRFTHASCMLTSSSHVLYRLYINVGCKKTMCSIKEIVYTAVKDYIDWKIEYHELPSDVRGDDLAAAICKNLYTEEHTLFALTYPNE